jgi:hypothetical protein
LGAGGGRPILPECELAKKTPLDISPICVSVERNTEIKKEKLGYKI